MKLEIIPGTLSVCRMKGDAAVDMTQPFTFISRTDEELSLVCRTDFVPEGTIEREDGWRAFRVCGVLDFSLIGILSNIASVLAEEKISIFAISTFNTDYVLTKERDFAQALAALKRAGYDI